MIYNIVISNANLDLLRFVDNDLEKKQVEYKGYPAPCVVFENEAGDVTFVAKTVEEYLNKIAPFSLDTAKENLQQKLQKSSKRTVELLNLKYELTNNLGMAQIMQNEYIAYSLDDTISTPTIDDWATAKGRTREEQIVRVGNVTEFTKFSAIMMEQMYSKTDVATIEAEIVEIEAILDELNSYDSIADVMAKKDEFLQRIRDVGAV